MSAEEATARGDSEERAARGAEIETEQETETKPDEIIAELTWHPIRRGDVTIEDEDTAA